MTDGIASLSIVDGAGFLAPFVLTAALLAILVSPWPWGPLRPAAHLRAVGIGALAGAAVGGLVTWVLSDVWGVFGISLTAVVRAADTVAFAALGVAAVNLAGTRWPRKVVAPGAVLATLLCLGLTINVDFGQYPRLGDALGLTYAQPAAIPALAGAPGALAAWTAPGGLPRAGRVGRVTIPATVSRFPARDAYVYLPPAALGPNPPALPVVVVLSGQPGEPADLFRAARLDVLLDGIASQHAGLAPIVVVPDQLGDPSENPLCVDGPLGNSATYLTVDVPAWIRTTLPVSTDRAAWAVAGFSQGGTCALQLGAAHPALFGAILDIAGEVAPTLGSVAGTVARGFDGDEAAYRAATPADLLAAGAPYADTAAVFVVGERDSQYLATMRTVSAKAAKAGMAVTTEVSPGTAHDWNTARYGFRAGFLRLLSRWGIP